jgi:hypothetical protein
VLETVVEVAFVAASEVGSVHGVGFLDGVVIEEALIEDRLGPRLVELLPREMLANAHSLDAESELRYARADLVLSCEGGRRSWEEKGRSSEWKRVRKRWMSFSRRSVKAAVELEKEWLILSSTLRAELKGLRRCTCDSCSRSLSRSMSK